MNNVSNLSRWSADLRTSICSLSWTQTLFQAPPPSQVDDCIGTLDVDASRAMAYGQVLKPADVSRQVTNSAEPGSNRLGDKLTRISRDFDHSGYAGVSSPGENAPGTFT